MKFLETFSTLIVGAVYAAIILLCILVFVDMSRNKEDKR